MKPLPIVFTCLITVAFVSCCKEKISDKPLGGANSISIYNEAYQENYDSDNITEILETAVNGYVLLDPYIEGNNSAITEIQANGNEVGAYISIGTGEDWRSDYNQLKPYLVDKEWGSWPGEYFVDVTNTGLLDVMKVRIDSIAVWGYNWVEFDNMDWAFDDKNRSKYDISATAEQVITYYTALCDYVHSKGMKCMAKNTVKSGSNFDGVLYESYRNEKDWWDSDGTSEFLSANKLVIINHYDECKCNTAYQEYLDIYGNGLSFICENKKLKKYVHYNE